jgi:hypothetical protein
VLDCHLAGLATGETLRCTFTFESPIGNDPVFRRPNTDENAGYYILTVNEEQPGIRMYDSISDARELSGHIRLED